MPVASIWAVLVLVLALVSLVLAIVGRDIASPTYLILFAIWMTLFLGAKSPW
jgi:hypothetical protein